MVAQLIQQLEAEEMARVRQLRELPTFSPGDTVTVRVRVREGTRERLQAFEGVCIERSGSGVNERFTIRKISSGEGVERVFPLHSPIINSLEVVRRGKVRRAKLYYLRERRGRAARIPELVLAAIRPGPGSDVRFGYAQVREFFKRMIGAIKGLQALGGAAEGRIVLDAVKHAMAALPLARPGSIPEPYGSDYVLTVADQLCPLLFSPDADVAACAREGFQQLGLLLGSNSMGDEGDGVRRLLLRIKAAIVVNLSVRPSGDGSAVTVVFRDIVDATTGRPGPALREPVVVQVLLEDMLEADSEVMATESIGIGSRKEARFLAAGGVHGLINRIVTITADGQEVCRSRLGGEAERIFIL